VKTESNKQYPKDMWWHHHPVFTVQLLGTSKPRPGQKPEFMRVWKYRERAAYTYELVRRLRAMVEAAYSDSSPEPAPEILQALAELPPYDELSAAWREPITDSLNFACGIRPLSVNPNAIPPSVKGYFVLDAIDVTAGIETAQDWLEDQVNQIRKRHGLEPGRGERGVSRNRGPHLKPHWDHLDYVCDRRRFDCADVDKRRFERNRFKDAIDNVDAVALGILHACLKEKPQLAKRLRLGIGGCDIPKVPFEQREWFVRKQPFPIVSVLVALRSVMKD
jgi:hypothetical protein